MQHQNDQIQSVSYSWRMRDDTSYQRGNTYIASVQTYNVILTYTVTDILT